MARVKVPLADNLKRVISINPDATQGATLGVDLRDASGRVIAPSEVMNSASSGNAGGSTAASTIWRLIREVPPNIQALAALESAGFPTRTASGQWTQRSVQAGDGIDVANGDGASGNPTVSLSDLPDSGAGAAILKIDRDAKGRVSGTSDASTDDLAEGPTNLYHTVERAVDAVAGALTDTPSIHWGYDDPAGQIRADVIAAGVEVAHLPGATYSTLQDYINTMGSPGSIDGPAAGIVDLGGGTIRVLAGKGMIRPADDDVSTLAFFNWPQADFVQPADGKTWFYGVVYNAGTPIVQQRAAFTWDLDTEIPLGSAARFASGATIITPNPYRTGDPITNIIQRFDAQSPAVRDNSVGGLILGNTGTRNATLTAGAIWSRLSNYAVAAKNSATAPMWSAYFNGTGLTITTGLTQWDNTRYNSGGTLVAVPPGARYANLYFFVSITGSAWGFAYGPASYNSVAAAAAEGVPAYLGQDFFNQSILLGRITFERNTDTPVSVSSAFTASFGVGLVSDHGNLAGIQDAPNAVAGHHYHLSAAQANDVANVAALGPGIPYRAGANSWALTTIGTGLSFSGGVLSATSSGDISLLFPIYDAAGVFTPIPLTADRELPFWLANGTQSNIPMVTA